MRSKYSDEQKITTAKRLKALREEKGVSHVTLKRELLDQCGLNISKDILIKYEIDNVYHSSFGATKGMATETLYCLAKYFNVSTDYLLANTDIRNPNPQMQATCEYTGLSEQAIDAIKSLNTGNDSYYYDTLGFKPPLMEILNLLHKEGVMTEMTKAIGRCLYEIIIRNEFRHGHTQNIEQKPRIMLAIGYLNKEITDAVNNVIKTLISELDYYYMAGENMP